MADFQTLTSPEAPYITIKKINANFSEVETRKVDHDGNKVLSDKNYSAAEQTKLGGIESGAEVNTIETVKVDGSALTPDANKAVNIAIPTYSIAVSSSTTSGYAKSYELQKNGALTGVKIDIPKDLVVSSGSVEEVVTTGSPYSGAVTGEKYIDLVLNDGGSSHIYIPVNDLVDAYTAGNGIAVSNANAISLVIDSSNANGLALSASGIKLTLATTSAPGAMSSADKTKLNGISTSAQVNTIETVMVNGSTLTPSSKAVDITVPTKIFAKAKVGSTIIEASSTTDTIELVAGSNIVLTPNAANKTITIAAQDSGNQGVSFTEESFTATDARWGAISNGVYTLTISSNKTPMGFVKKLDGSVYVDCLAGASSNGTSIYIKSDAKFAGKVATY